MDAELLIPYVHAPKRGFLHFVRDRVEPVQRPRRPMCPKINGRFRSEQRMEICPSPTAVAWVDGSNQRVLEMMPSLGSSR